MLSIVLKGTNGCNLACSYCSLGNKKNVSKVTKEKIYDIMRYSCELCEHISEKHICFILHGGEPTIISSSAYGYAIDRIKNEYKNLNIEISLQTNGYNLSEEWIDFFKRYDVSVGVSVDGSALIHDSERITINGENTFAVVKLGDVRDNKGELLGLVPDFINLMREIGYKYYNEIILINQSGTGAIRSAGNMKSRKIVKCHQNVLVFYKGDLKKIKDKFPELR